MRKTAIVACLSVLATALSAQTSTTDKFANQSDRSLKVEVLPPSYATHEPIRYRLSEPAYVAAFMVYPGAGVRLLYPQVDMPEQLRRAGYNVGQLLPIRLDDDAYRAILGPAQAGPAYLYVIASRHPLDVARYVNRPARLASTVGWNDSRSFYPSVAFDGIINNAVSLGDDQSWDSDVYTIWPQDVADAKRSNADRNSPRAVQYRLMVCADGQVRAVPYNYPFAGCAGDGRVRANSSESHPVVQQSASAAQTSAPSAAQTGAQMGTQTSAPSASRSAVALVNSGATPSLGTGSAAPTVLPTIIGKRAPQADRGDMAAQARAPSTVMYTTANGDQSNEPPAVKVAPGVRIEMMDAGSAHRRLVDRADIDARARERRHAPDQNGPVVGRAPQLAPSPRLAPNPRLAPDPHASSTRSAPVAPRDESEQRARRESMRVPPAPPSAPREPPPTAKP